MEAPDESVAVSALLHDLCKIGCYKAGSRNVKGPTEVDGGAHLYYEDKSPMATERSPCTSSPAL